MMIINKTELSNALVAENETLVAQIDLNTSQISAMELALSDPWASGKRYAAIKERITNLRVPIAKAHSIIFDAIARANEQNITAIALLPDAEGGVIDTDDFQKLADDLEEQNERLRNYHNAFDFNINEQTIENNESAIQILRDSIDAAENYELTTRDIYDNAKTLSSDVLSKSTDSLNTYLNNKDTYYPGGVGTNYGDMSWLGSIDEAYDKVQSNQLDRKLKKLSAENPGVVYMSDDYQRMFYNGEQWEIDSEPYNPGLSLPPDAEPGFYASSPRPTNSEFAPFSEEQFNWAKFMAGFGEDWVQLSGRKGAKYDPVQSKIPNGTKAAITTSGVLGNAAGAMEEYEFAFRFDTYPDGSKKVAILGRDDRWSGEINGSNYDKGFDSFDEYKQTAKRLYEIRTGEQADNRKYSLDITFDPARDAPSAYDWQYYFDTEGNLKASSIRYPKDKAVAKVGSQGYEESYDVSAIYFDPWTVEGVHPNTTSMIKGNTKNAE